MIFTPWSVDRDFINTCTARAEAVGVVRGSVALRHALRSKQKYAARACIYRRRVNGFVPFRSMIDCNSKLPNSHTYDAASVALIP
jgi:hypothetical protein